MGLVYPSAHTLKLRRRPIKAHPDTLGGQRLRRRCSNAANTGLIIPGEATLDASQDQVWVWYARVPTHANCADNPLRLILIPSEANDYADVGTMPPIPDSLFPPRQL